MLPYRSADRFLQVLSQPDRVPAHLLELVAAINRSEGLADPRRLGDVLGLQPRDVRRGTIRSYRLFQLDSLTLEASGGSASAYLEGGPDYLSLRYHGEGGHVVQLEIRLDLYELLQRLRDGYLPGVAELQGLFLALTIFKNELSAAPYQELLLTSSGRDLHRIRREPDGRLVMAELAPGRS
jgi:hypothetical protein